MKHIITGVKPTGESMHIGNYLGAILPFGQLAQNNFASIFIADLHALTSVFNGETLRKQTLELAIEYFTIYGIDTPIHIFRQSDIHGLTELFWILCNSTPYSLIDRAHSMKDSQAKGIDLHMGVVNYPILMAADIIGYDIDIVPVGKDQLQHLEMTRDIARYFNKRYGSNCFIEPQSHVTKEAAVVPGIDGRKMSKSYNNFIGIFDSDAVLKKRISSIISDSRGMDEAKDPDSCTIFALIQAFGTPEEIAVIRSKYLQSGIGFGYGHAKQALFEILQRTIAPLRNRREVLLQDSAGIEKKLQEGATVMNRRLNRRLKEVARLTGILSGKFDSF